jgi:hypothetical protein
MALHRGHTFYQFRGKRPSSQLFAFLVRSLSRFPAALAFRAASTDTAPAPTINMNTNPSTIEKSVRASCNMLSRP